MSSSGDFLLLLHDLNLLRGLKLLQLLLHRNQKVLFVGTGLGRHGVQGGGHGLVVDHGLGHTSGGGHKLSLKIEK